MIEKIKALREQIDGLAQLTKELKPYFGTSKDKVYNLSDFQANHMGQVKFDKSVEQQHTYESLILAKAWLGKILGQLGNPTPYQNDGKRKDVKDIEPTAERRITGTIINDDGKEKNHIEKVDWLRQEIEKISKNELSSGDMTEEEHQYIKDNPDCGKLYFYETMYQQYLTEARFWLGFELQRIREEQTK